MSFFLIQLFKQHHLKGESEICYVVKRGEFNKGIEKIKEEKTLKEMDIELMREWVRSGMAVDDAVAEYLEEGLYETEDSYRIKSEQISDYLIR